MISGESDFDESNGSVYNDTLFDCEYEYTDDDDKYV